jgi:transposase-like protein
VKRWARFSKPVGTSCRVDETYIPIKGKWHYLYRAVDKHGKTIDFLLRPDRGIAAAQAFFRKALATQAPRVPRKVTLDGHVPSHRAAVVAAPGASVLEKRQGQKLQVPEQHHRARSSGDQATLCVDDWIQVVCECRYHDLRH